MSAKVPQHAANMSSIGIILVSVLFSALGQLTFKAALNTIGELTLTPEVVLNLATNGLFLLGLAMYGGSAFLWLLALMKADISFAYPFLSLAYIIVVAGGLLLFNEPLTLARAVGVVIIIAGLWVIAWSEHAK